MIDFIAGFSPSTIFWTHERDRCTFKEDNCQLFCSLLKRGLLKRKEFALFWIWTFAVLIQSNVPYSRDEMHILMLCICSQDDKVLLFFTEKKKKKKEKRRRSFEDISCKLSFQGNGFRYIRQTVSLGKQVLTFHANCLLRQFAWNVKVCFLGK